MPKQKNTSPEFFKRNLKSLSLFTLKEQVLLLFILTLNRFGNLKDKTRWKALKVQKDEIDFLLIKNFSIAKVRNNPGVLDVRSIEGNIKALLRKFTSDFKVFHQVIINREYQFLIDLTIKYSQSDKINIIVDAGANIGLTTLFFKEKFPDAEVVLLEPDDFNFSFLRQNLSHAGHDGLKPLKKALWHTNDFLSVSGSFRDGAEWGKQVVTAKPGDKAQIPSTTLKTLLDDEKIEIIDLLKIDIEGAEKHLFDDDQTLAVLRSRVKFLAIEIHVEEISKAKVFTTLQNLNYLLFDRGETTFAVNQNLLIEYATE